MVTNEVRYWLSVNNTTISYQPKDSEPSQMDVQPAIAYRTIVTHLQHSLVRPCSCVHDFRDPSLSRRNLPAHALPPTRHLLPPPNATRKEAITVGPPRSRPLQRTKVLYESLLPTLAELPLE